MRAARFGNPRQERSKINRRSLERAVRAWRWLAQPVLAMACLRAHSTRSFRGPDDRGALSVDDAHAAGVCPSARGVESSGSNVQQLIWGGLLVVRRRRVSSLVRVVPIKENRAH